MCSSPARLVAMPSGAVKQQQLEGGAWEMERTTDTEVAEWSSEGGIETSDATGSAQVESGVHCVGADPGRG